MNVMSKTEFIDIAHSVGADVNYRTIKHTDDGDTCRGHRMLDVTYKGETRTYAVGFITFESIVHWLKEVVE